MTSASTYRVGDIAMVYRYLGSTSQVAVCMHGYLTDQITWHLLGGSRTSGPAEIGPVIGNVADIAAGGQS